MDKFLTQDLSPTDTEDGTSSASDDDTNSSFISREDDEVEDQDVTSDEEAENVNENVCHPVLSCITGNRTTLFKFRAEGVVNDLPEHKDIAAKYRLTYKQGRSTCHLIENLLVGHGFRETDQEALDYNLCWMGSHVKPQFLASMQSFQRVNHFPRSFEITRKDRLYKNVEKMQQAKGFKNFDFVPQTFILPVEYNEFLAKSYKEKSTWIIKPAALSRGRGIFLTTNPEQCLSGDKAVACKYITNPLLINGLKFDIRLYVAVTSFDPLVIYLYEEGLTRFATIPFDKSTKAISNTCMHLTNYSVNKRSRSFISNKNSEVENQGSKWTLGALLRHLRKEGHDTTSLMLSIEDVIIKTMIAGETPISAACKSFINFKANCFELFGFDILLDENFKPWVLEVNLSPSLACDAPLDLKVKSNMVSDLLNLVGVECQDPVTRKNFANLAANKMKTTKVGRLWWRKKLCLHQKVFRNREAAVLTSNNNQLLRDTKSTDNTTNWQLTNEEQRMLSRFKDEFERKGKWVRIFPTETSWDTYRELFLSFRANNIILHKELFAENRKNRRNMEKTGHKDYLDKEAYLYHMASQRCKQYERCLSVLSPSSSTVSLKKVSRRNPPERSSQDSLSTPSDNSQSSNERNLTGVKGHPEQVTPSADGRDSGKCGDNDLRNVLLAHGFSLSYLQARRVFSAYLRHLTGRSSGQVSDNTDAILHFLRKAGSRLCRGFAFSEPQAWLTAKERRSTVDLQLQKFLALFHEESLNLEKQQLAQDSKKVKELAGNLDNQVLDTFIEKASKSDLEIIFNLYTEQELNRSLLASTNQKTSTSCDSSSKDSLPEKKGGHLLEFSEVILARRPKWAQFGRPSGSLQSRRGASSALPTRTLTPTSSSSFLSAFSIYGGVNPLTLRPFSSLFDRLSKRVDPNLVKTFDRLRIRVNSAHPDPGSHPLDVGYKGVGPSESLVETIHAKPARNFYASNTKKVSKKGSNSSRLSPENQSEAKPRAISEKSVENTSSTKSRSKEEIGDPSLSEFDNYLTPSGRHKSGRNKNLVFSSSGVFRVDEMGDHKANCNPEKDAHLRYMSTNQNAPSEEWKESKHTELKNKTPKNEKRSKTSRDCAESDQSQDEECEMARGTADESEMLGSLKNLSFNLSPQWDAISIKRMPKHATPSPKGSRMRRSTWKVDKIDADH